MEISWAHKRSQSAGDEMTRKIGINSDGEKDDQKEQNHSLAPAFASWFIGGVAASALSLPTCGGGCPCIGGCPGCCAGG